jgi:chitosanase
LSATPPGCYDWPPPGGRPLSVQSPLLRGLDVRLVQLALSERGADIKADGVFGQMSSKRIKELQLAEGLPATGIADVPLIARLVG